MKDDRCDAGGPQPQRKEAGPARAPVQPITLVQVGKAAGVSTITASRALHNPGKVSPRTVQRVKDAARSIGYVPNLLAGGLKSRRSRLVAMLLPTIAGSPFLRAIQALTDTLAEHGYQVMIGQTGYDHSHEEGLLDAIIGRRPDGIVVSGLIRSAGARTKLQASGIPVVETWEMCDTPVDMLVGLSHPRVGAAVAHYLWGRGRRRFAIASADDARGAQRRQGFLQALNALALADGVARAPIPEFTVPAPSDANQGRRALVALMKTDPAIDALYCSSDMLALGALCEAQAQGIPVPAQLAIFGYGDVDLAAATHPGLSTIRVDDIAIGREAARRIVERAEGRWPAPAIVDMGFSVVERGSS